MVVFVLASVFCGLVAAIAALISGMSLLLAFAIYVGVGISAMALVLVRAVICLHLKGSDEPLTTTA
ncbi:MULTISPECIES: hypothetical protein [unclassified Roseovarius]|uniref:hypothetical protein n=1 Tax=unclassified Roseovarius TaxID=2614913 RepID=UPI00273F4F07|nr:MULTISPECIES: hypothetical protein [unclassified Roseovarius]